MKYKIIGDNLQSAKIELNDGEASLPKPGRW
ncbi:MAG: hypothetical protein METHP_00235 [Methanoregula sp. SKADARSKE-2]|nr:MAG: hypothetical protein METHP_00235 [Methanoregula sp. SKADARSKE-2]